MLGTPTKFRAQHNFGTYQTKMAPLFFMGSLFTELLIKYSSNKKYFRYMLHMLKYLFSLLSITGDLLD